MIWAWLREPSHFEYFLGSFGHLFQNCWFCWKFININNHLRRPILSYTEDFMNILFLEVSFLKFYEKCEINILGHPMKKFCMFCDFHSTLTDPKSLSLYPFSMKLEFLSKNKTFFCSWWQWLPIRLKFCVITNHSTNN